MSGGNSDTLVAAHNRKSDGIYVVEFATKGNGTEKMTAPEETQADVASRGFWNQGTTYLIDACTVHL